MSRPRKPTNLLKLTGGCRADRHGGAEPNVEGSPRSLTELTGIAAEFWQAFAGPLEAAGIATIADSAALTVLAETWHEYRRTHDELKLLRPVDDGYYRLIVIRATLVKSLDSLLSKFGMNPSARAQLRIEPPNGPGIARRQRVPCRDRGGDLDEMISRRPQTGTEA